MINKKKRKKKLMRLFRNKKKNYSKDVTRNAASC